MNIYVDVTDALKKKEIDPHHDGQAAGETLRRSGSGPGKYSGNRFTAVHVWNHSAGGFLFPNGNAGRPSGRFYDEFYFAQSPADCLQRGVGKHGADRPPRLLLFLRGGSRPVGALFLREQDFF